MARHGDMGFADAMSWILPIDFQIPESIRGYIGLIDTQVLQSIGIFLIFVMVIILLRRVGKVAALHRHVRNEVAALQDQVERLLTEQRRSLADPQARRQTAPDGGFALNPAETALKLAVMETELKALKEMVTELRQARDDWKAQAWRASPWPTPPITAVAPADAPSALASATTVAPEPS
ncbi:MAG: hypothetical protein WAV18_16035 [Roseiarcus sp.]